MEYKKLGKSDVLVSELILGCWAMGGDYFGATEDKSSLEALEVSYENGVNTFDTAEIYGDGRSERGGGRGCPPDWQGQGANHLQGVQALYVPR